MSEGVILTGMVLTAMSVGDYDKRITILTTERGKITAFARGAKRPNSQLMACSNPFVFGEFELNEGKNAYTLYKATVKNYFRELTMDPEAAYMGFYFMEFASYVCQENNDEKEMLKLCYQSLRALMSEKFDKRLVRMAFELKAMGLQGLGPNVFSCGCCRKKENLHLFSVAKGGIYCRVCESAFPGKPISETALYTMQYILATPPEKLFSFGLKKEILDELVSLNREYLEYYLHHRFKSLEILESLSCN